MQYDHVLKKLNFNLVTPRVRGGGGGSAGIIFAASVIPFNLVCNMTMF